MTRLALVLLLAAPAVAAPTEVYDFVEIPVERPPLAGDANPFAELEVTATVRPPAGVPFEVRGFVDSADGSRAAVRVMPELPGDYRLGVRVTSKGGAVSETRALFTAVAGKRRGPLEVDRAHPHHFVYRGTGEHVFWNGTTAYWMLGVTDDARIAAAIDRLAEKGVNRIRVALNARTTGGDRWFEPQVRESADFRFRVDPWPARSDDPKKPDLDVTRFNVPMWQKLDRLVRHARDRGVIVSIIFHLDGADAGVDPFNGGKDKGKGYAGSPAEEAYYRYAVARLAAYSNVMWDLTNEWHLFRTPAWVNRFGMLVRAEDPYRHLITVHGRGDFPFYGTRWAGLALYQSWDEAGGYAFMREARRQGDRVKPMPHVNEEYGYEDHYPGPWGGGKKAPARDADSRRRLAWEMAMAGGYQTTGERADVPGQGGWLTGLGDARMTLLDGHRHMLAFFTSVEWWRFEPRDDQTEGGAYLLARGDDEFLCYAPKGGKVTIKLPAGDFEATPYDPKTGKWAKAAPARGQHQWQTPEGPDAALRVRRR